MVNLPAGMVQQAIENIIERMMRPDDIERRVHAEIERRLGTVSIDEAARMFGWEARPFRRKLKVLNVMVFTLAKTKQRMRVVDCERMLADHMCPLNKRRRVKKPDAKPLQEAA